MGKTTSVTVLTLKEKGYQTNILRSSKNIDR